MCMDAMEIKKEIEVFARCPCERMRLTRWRQRKLDRGGGEKCGKKWTGYAARATARKYKRQARCRHASRRPFSRPSARLYGSSLALRPVETCHGRPAGTMAPKNTTQYLMNIVYRDLVRDSAREVESLNCRKDGGIDLSRHPQSEQIAGRTVPPQSEYEPGSTEDFLQRDFERMFLLHTDCGLRDCLP
ncbi:coiled-coil domain-containing glutamate-rich protein 1 [Amia ocellicauda]|uniref:coiled-coil domain-containing glutamate-rich protein 1 n=1 Tax=Amia ocellicauda TaxID=2972642 RepID=UPI0034645F83